MTKVRPRQALGARRPDEVRAVVERPKPRAITVSDHQPEISVKRKRFRSDHRLTVFDIEIGRSA